MRLLGIVLLSGVLRGQNLSPASECARLTRLPTSPIITPVSSPTIGSNINGPAIIRTPAWLPKPLGRYYLYFADHTGSFIRLAYADRPDGKWKIHEGGTLHLKDSFFDDHIASPEVIVDDPSHTIRLYFHGGYLTKGKPQDTRVAVSRDGISFQTIEQPVGGGSAYWRLFQHDGYWYAVSIGGRLHRSRDPLAAFEDGPSIFPRSPAVSHNAVLIEDERLTVFYTRAGDTPEQILVSHVDLSTGWEDWHASAPQTCLTPQTKWEGADLPLKPGRIGPLDQPENALRDPAVLRDGNTIYLVYAIAGESGLAIARLR
jgi:hypothetical protein